MKKYKAISLDLDGTLVDSNKEIPKANKEAVWKAIDKGVAVILASGRPLFGVLPVAEKLELKKRGGYVLAYNGGNIWDCKEEKLVYSKNVPMECIEDILDTEEISADMLKGGKQYFGLKIKGDSMEPDYLDGDTIILQKVDDCENGDDCVVMVNGSERYI